MSIPFDLTQSDIWSDLKRKIEKERAARLEGLLHVTPEGLRGDQQFIAALDWVLNEATPQPAPKEFSIYED